MIKLDHDFLADCGYGSLTAAQGTELLRAIYEAAEEIVGIRLASEWSESQMATFERFFDQRKDKEAFEWLQRNNPDYEKVVNDIFDTVKATLRAAAAPLSREGGADIDSNR